MDFSSCLRRSLMDKETCSHSRECLAPPFSLSAIHAVSYTRLYYNIILHPTALALYSMSINTMKLVAGFHNLPVGV